MRTASADTKYQSTFLPIFQDAETRIKTLVVLALCSLWGEYVLRLRVAQVIADVQKKIGDIPNRDVYIRGLMALGNKLITKDFREAKGNFLTSQKTLGLKRPNEVFSIAPAKASPNVTDYAKELRKRIKQIAEQPTLTIDTGKKPISLWQKAELDVRYEHQIKMIEDLKANGNDLCYISSHPDCSKRCERWQGKLVSLTLPSRWSGFRCGKVDGKWVYSLTEIMAQTDKYGYHNNVICGFNCRHRLIPYHGQLPPTQFSKEDVGDQRRIETDIRAMERDIRKTKEEAYLLDKAKDPRASYLKTRIKRMEAKYKSFCDRHGYAWEQYRIQINYTKGI